MQTNATEVLPGAKCEARMSQCAFVRLEEQESRVFSVQVAVHHLFELSAVCTRAVLNKHEAPSTLH